MGVSVIKVGLFLTCLANSFRPSIGWASLSLLEACKGVQVLVPQAQSCCAQPSYNSGDIKATKAVLRAQIKAFESVDYIVCPSGSCAGMLKKAQDILGEEGAQLSSKTIELCNFLVDIAHLKLEPFPSAQGLPLAYHDSCSARREALSYDQPRILLESRGYQLLRPTEEEACCGFGGTFSVKYPELSTAIGDDKLRNLKKTGAKIIVSADLGCLMHLYGRAQHQGLQLKAYHIAELLTDPSLTAAHGQGGAQ